MGNYGVDAEQSRKAVTLHDLKSRRASGNRIAMLTAYDASFAQLLDDCGVDVLLIGDSLGMVIQGHDSTLPVSVDEMVYHTQCVARVKPKAWVIADMPFGSYQESPEQAYANAAALISAGAQMVKLEGGGWLAPTVEFLSTRGIAVCAHLGLTPQSVHSLGGYRVQGRCYPGRSTDSRCKTTRDKWRGYGAGGINSNPLGGTTNRITLRANHWNWRRPPYDRTGLGLA